MLNATASNSHKRYPLIVFLSDLVTTFAGTREWVSLLVLISAKRAEIRTEIAVLHPLVSAEGRDKPGSPEIIRGNTLNPSEISRVPDGHGPARP